MVEPAVQKHRVPVRLVDGLVGRFKTAGEKLDFLAELRTA